MVCINVAFRIIFSILAWVIPGGGIEIGEEMHEAVLREVEEEAGVRADVLELIGEFQARFPNRFIQAISHVCVKNRGKICHIRDPYQ
jgi:8-oxo-dGTP pyrophosphatase MutT (NUDIX family)